MNVEDGRRGGAAPVQETKEWLAVRDRYELYLKATVRASPATVRSYLGRGSAFARWCKAEGEPLITASRDAVARYVAWQHEHRASSTAANCMLAARSLYRWAISEGLREDDPTEGMKPKRGKAQARRPYDDNELRALLKACLHQRDRALILLLLASGLRRGELTALTTDDIDWNSGVIRVRKGKGDKQRTVAVSLTILSELKSYLGERTGHIWITVTGAPMSGHQIYSMIRKLAERAGVSDAGAHRFRATFANRFLQDGGDVGALQSVMGHSDPRQTLHYAAYSQQERALKVQRRQRFAGLVAGEAVEEDETTQKQEQELKADAGRARYRLDRSPLLITLKLLARGLSAAEIAKELNLTRQGAAESRIDTLLRRMGASNVTEACVKGAQAGLLDDLFAEEEKEVQEKKRQDELRRRVAQARQRTARRRTKSSLRLIKGGNN